VSIPPYEHSPPGERF